MRQARQKHTTLAFEISRQAAANLRNAATYNKKRDRVAWNERCMMFIKLRAQPAHTMYFAEASSNFESAFINVGEYYKRASRDLEKTGLNS